MKGQTQAINKEFANIFTTLSARVEVFQTTQKTFLENYHADIISNLPELNESDINITAAVYGICITDDALKSYSITQFSEDIVYLRSLIIKSEEKKEEEIESIEVKDIDENLPTHNLPTHNLPPKKKKIITLADRVKTAIETETDFMKILTAYYQVNSIIERAINNFNNEMIIHHVNERPEIVITSLLIRNHLLTLYEKIYMIYSSANIDVDLRYITAQIIVAIERIISTKSEIDSMYKIFIDVTKRYPLGSGDDLYWDLSEQMIYIEYYPKLKSLLQPQIDDGIAEKLKSAETMKNKMEQVKAQNINAHSRESIRAKVDSIIFESFHFNRPFTSDARGKMQRAVESVLKRMALEEYGSQDIPNIERFKDYFSTEFFIPIFNEYPQLYLPLIDIREYRAFVNDPIKTAENQMEYILSQFWFSMRRHGLKDKPGPSQLAHSFSMVMFDIMNNDKVLNFD